MHTIANNYNTAGYFSNLENFPQILPNVQNIYIKCQQVIKYSYILATRIIVLFKIAKSIILAKAGEIKIEIPYTKTISL